MSLVLEDDQANYYNNTVGKLRWILELGTIDINLEISLLSRYLDQTRHGHIDQVFHNFSFIKSHAKRKLTLYPFNICFLMPNLWRIIGSQAREDSVTVAHFVDADHSSDMMNCCSHTRIIIHLCRDPIIWYSKKQNTVESSTFRL